MVRWQARLALPKVGASTILCFYVVFAILDVFRLEIQHSLVIMSCRCFLNGLAWIAEMGIEFIGI